MRIGFIFIFVYVFLFTYVLINVKYVQRDLGRKAA